MFHKKIAHGSFVLPRIATKASGDKIFKTIIAAFDNGHDVIQRGCEACKLLLAIAALVGIPLVHFDAVLPNVVKVDIGGGYFRLRFRCSPFSTKFPASLDFIRDQDSIRSPFPVGFTFLTDCTDGFQGSKYLTNLCFISETTFSIAFDLDDNTTPRFRALPLSLTCGLPFLTMECRKAYQ